MKNAELARDDCLQQLSYLAALARGLADPEGDVIDLDASLDETSLVRETATRILNEPRVLDMRRALETSIEAVATTWPGDAEIVTALADYVRQSTSDAVPSPLALASRSLLDLCAGALQLSASSVWLGIEAQLLARLARDSSDGTLSDSDLAALSSPVERSLQVILAAYADVAGTHILLLVLMQT